MPGALIRIATTITLVRLERKNNLKLTKPRWAYNNAFSYHGYQEISKSTGTASDFRNSQIPSVIFPVLSSPPGFGWTYRARNFRDSVAAAPKVLIRWCD